MNDEWYESEARTRDGMIQELQRIKLRAFARPLPILALAALITGALVYKVATKKQLVEADVVLLLTDGSLARRDTPIPVEDLKDYVANVLLPDNKLLELIERKNLYRLRKKLGNQFAIDSLREQLEITVWKNSYVYYDPDLSNAERSARIGITVIDTDPDLAFDLARDLASIVVTTQDEHSKQVAAQLAKDIAGYRASMDTRLDELQREQAEKEAALAEAKAAGKNDVAAALQIVLDRVAAEEFRVRDKLDTIAGSSDVFADRVTSAGLDTTLSVVEEHRPEKPEQRSFVLLMIVAVVGVGSLFGAALVVGSFDSRIHESDDVTRLGLPIIGHVPGFAGDGVGSLRARGIIRGKLSTYVVVGLIMLLVCGPIGVILLLLGIREVRRSRGALAGGSVAVGAIIAWCALVVAALVMAGRG